MNKKVSKKPNNLKSILQRFLDHPDKDEIVAKLSIGVPVEDISSWLSATYSNPGEDHLIISVKDLNTFSDNFLDFYSTIKEDLSKVYKNKSLTELENQTKEIIQGNTTYKQKLEEYLDKEIDIKQIVKNLVISIEWRASQVFEQIQNDPKNIKMDRVLIEWFNTLTNTLEKYDAIINGAPVNVINNNNITIQVVDQQLTIFQNIIHKILAELDYEKSLYFIDLINKEFKKLKPAEEGLVILPQEVRQEQVVELQNNLIKTL